MRDTCYSVGHSIVFAFILLISFTLHVYDLLQGTLFKSAVCVCTLSGIATSREEVDIHLAIFTIVAIVSDLLADIMVLSMASNLNLQYLTVDDVRRLLLDCGDLACRFVTYFNADLNIDILSGIDVSCLQKSRLDRHDVEVAQSLKMEPVVGSARGQDRVG